MSMKNLKSSKLVITFVVLAFIMSFSGNAFAAVTTRPTKAALEQKWTNPASRDLKGISISQNKNILQASFDVTSSDDLTSRIQYILANRLTDVNLHIIYSFNTTELSNQLNDMLRDGNSIDDYLYGSIMSWSANGTENNGDYNIQMQISYVETKAQADSVETQVRQILSQIIKPNMSDLNKEKAIHDYIVSNVSYDESLVDHSDYGALFNKHTTVCQGYALLCYRMLTDAGINARLVVSDNGPNEVGHAWNMAQINGKWYHLDCTYDDPTPDVPGRVEYNYFNKTDAEMEANHTWDRTKYPAATTEFNFLNTSGMPNIDSVILGKSGEITVNTSGISGGTKINFSLVHEYGSDASETDGKANIIFMDDDPTIYGDTYSGQYFIPEYVPEGNYKIKVNIGAQISYSDVISVKRDSQITVSSIQDGYIGKDISSTLTGTAEDKDGIDDVEVCITNSDGNYINLNTGVYDGDFNNTAEKVNLNSDGTFSQSIPVIDKLADGKYSICISVFDSNEFETMKAISFTKSSTYDWQKILNDKPWKTKYGSLSELNTLMNVASDKKFTVKFSQDVDFSTLNSSNVQIIDAENGQSISSVITKLTNNSLQVSPNSILTAGRVYYIVISNDTLKSVNSTSLNNGVVCPFKVADN